MKKKSNQKNKNIMEESFSLEKISSGLRKDNTSEKEYRSFNRKSEESQSSSCSTKSSPPESVESVLYNIPLDNFGFGTKTFNPGNDQEEGTSRAKMLRENLKKKVEESSVMEDQSEELYFAKNNDFCRSGMSYYKFDKRSKSHDSLDRPSENLELKKTEELTNFNMYLHAGVNILSTNRLKCLGERSTAVSHSKQKEFANFEKDFKICMVNERNLLDSSIDHLSKEKRAKSFAPLRSYEQSRQKTHRSLIENDQVALDRDLISLSEEDLEIKRYLQDVCFFSVFLIFVTTIALSMVSSNMYYFSEKTIELFFDTPNSPPVNVSHNTELLKEENKSTTSNFPRKTLRESNTFKDFWAFAESTMIDMFYWNFYYSHMDPLIHTKEDDKKMFFENQILGVPRMRQVRVKNDSCEIHPDVKRFFINCYNYYSVFSEETRPIKEGMENSLTATAWVYTEAEELNSSYYWGEISIYGGGGYYLDLSSSKETTVKMIKELKDNFWISRATRAVFIDFNLYNANVNLFCLCKIVLEFPPVGGMLPKPDFHSLKLLRYVSMVDFFILGFEFVFILFVIYYTWKEIMIIIKQKVSFFFFWWNYIDLLILILSYTYIVLNVLRYIYVYKVIHTLSDRYFEYTEFGFIKELQINFNNTMALLLFICWIKLFKYLNFNVVMVEFKKTLSRSFKDILGFFPMFLTMFVAFALLAYLLFGNQVKSYNTLWFSFLALLQAFLGEFEYEEIQESNRILGPIYYIAFIFFIFFVLLNVFIAIINDAYVSVKSEVISDTPKTGEYLSRGFLNFLKFCCCGLDKKLVKKSKIKKKIVFNEIKQALKNAGFNEAEINIFFKKYDINITNILDDNTRRKIIEDLELDRIDFRENSEQFQISSLRRRIDSLSEKIESIELNLHPIMDKVDVLLGRL